MSDTTATLPPCHPEGDLATAAAADGGETDELRREEVPSTVATASAVANSSSAPRSTANNAAAPLNEYELAREVTNTLFFFFFPVVQHFKK